MKETKNLRSRNEISQKRIICPAKRSMKVNFGFFGGGNGTSKSSGKRIWGGASAAVSSVAFLLSRISSAAGSNGFAKGVPRVCAQCERTAFCSAGTLSACRFSFGRKDFAFAEFAGIQRSSAETGTEACFL